MLTVLQNFRKESRLHLDASLTAFVDLFLIFFFRVKPNLHSEEL